MKYADKSPSHAIKKCAPLLVMCVKGKQKKVKRSLQQLWFEGSHPSKSWTGPTLLNLNSSI